MAPVRPRLGFLRRCQQRVYLCINPAGTYESTRHTGLFVYESGAVASASADHRNTYGSHSLKYSESMSTFINTVLTISIAKQKIGKSRIKRKITNVYTIKFVINYLWSDVNFVNTFSRYSQDKRESEKYDGSLCSRT